MTIEQFWELIEQCRNPTSGDTRLGLLERSIRALSAKDIVAFEGHSWDMMSLSYRREIWAIATIIQPSCSQTSFEAARGWMILEGRGFFEDVCANPESFAARIPRGRVVWLPEGDMLLRMTPRIYRNTTGEDLPTLPRTIPYVIKGERWTEFDLPEMYPRLWMKYRM